MMDFSTSNLFDAITDAILDDLFHGGGGQHCFQVEFVAQAQSGLVYHPEVIFQQDCDGYMLLHFAAKYTTPELCRVIVELDVGSSNPVLKKFLVVWDIFI
jgi:hypothetical protein